MPLKIFFLCITIPETTWILVSFPPIISMKTTKLPPGPWAFFSPENVARGALSDEASSSVKDMQDGKM